jgi:hypothetical protein
MLQYSHENHDMLVSGNILLFEVFLSAWILIKEHHFQCNVLSVIITIIIVCSYTESLLRFVEGGNHVPAAYSNVIKMQWPRGRSKHV